MSDLLVRGVRVVDLDHERPGGPSTPPEPLDVLVTGGLVRRVGRDLAAPRGGEVLHGEGAFVIPGLWDQHVHLDQWTLQRLRLDTAGATCVEDVLALLRARLAGPDDDGRSLVQGFGHRSAGWPRRGTAADLDAVVGDRPVVLISGDAHHGWLSTAALRRLGLPTGPGAGVVEEVPWFEAYARLDEVFGTDPRLDEGRRAVLADAAAQGIVGVVDLEFGGAWQWWGARVGQGLDSLRVRAATYPQTLEEVLDAGLRSGDPLEPSGLATMGPLKVITDGSLGTRTACCCEPYVGSDHRGALNVDPAELAALLERAHRGGLWCAIHAIGDAAVSHALDAFAATGAQGAIEHAQLVRWEDLPRMASLALRASVQPAHLLDDRDATEACWADRADRCFALRSMLDAGVVLALGSDAPVAPLDPWLAMAAAVHRSGDEREAWYPEQAVTAREALAASVDGRRVRAGSPGDLVLLRADPTARAGEPHEVAAGLRATRPLATVVGGRVVHGA